MSQTKVALRTDFHDYYDHYFDLQGMIFERFSYQGMQRKSMLDFLSDVGFDTPLYGTVQEVYDQIDDIDFLEVVVYLDQMAHQGEGKIKIPMRQAITEYPDHLCSVYIPPKTGQVRSLRYLQVGNKRFWLKYASKDDWRSNYGDVEIEVLTQVKDGYHAKIHYPLFAIDFIANTNELMAVDFNIS